MNETNTFLGGEADAPRVVARGEHCISRANISPNALKVLYRLKDAGYQAFLVGGAVRDLMLGLNPKDFDVATNARPEQVKQLFRNCRLIGRRFHLAHVRYGREIIEVATFRAAHGPLDDDDSVDEAGRRVLDDRGRILRDNLYGRIDEDVWRRDFTANALYYNIEDFSIRDYVGGFDDAHNRVLRLIGDPQTRYREDPVRMLRAVRFAAKLGFSIHPDTAAPIPGLARMLDGVPAARLFDEINKLLLAGNAARGFELLVEMGLLGHLFPELAMVLAQAPELPGMRLLRLGLAGTDERVHAGKPVTPTFLFAVLLWPAIQYRLGAVNEASDMQALLASCDQVIAAQQARIALPKRFVLPMREMMALQLRLERREGRRALRLLDHPRFRAAYDFLLLRAAAGEVDESLAQWWTEIQSLDPQARIAKIEALPGRSRAQDDGEGKVRTDAARGKSGRRRRRPRRPPAAV